MTEIPTYYPGQIARGAITFVSFEPVPIAEVVAFFAYEQTTSGFNVSSENLAPGTEGDNTWEVVFDFPIEASDRPGLYHCSRVTVTYESGSVMHFEPLPNAAFRIDTFRIEEAAKNPEPLTEWRWIDG